MKYLTLVFLIGYAFAKEDEILIWGQEKESTFFESLDGRDILKLKSGRIYRGKYLEKTSEYITFWVIHNPIEKIDGSEDYRVNFSTDKVETITTNRGKVKLKYPFDLPSKWYLKKNSSELKTSVYCSIAFLVYILVMEVYSINNSGKGVLF